MDDDKVVGQDACSGVAWNSCWKTLYKTPLDRKTAKMNKLTHEEAMAIDHASIFSSRSCLTVDLTFSVIFAQAVEEEEVEEAKKKQRVQE